MQIQFYFKQAFLFHQTSLFLLQGSLIHYKFQAYTFCITEALQYLINWNQ